MDFGKAFTFVFDDPDWIKKVLLGGVISAVPILNFASMGYSLEVAQRVIRNDPRPLPEWDDFGGKIVKGLLYAVIGFVYALPILLLVCIMQVAMFALTGTIGVSTQSSQSASEAAGTAVIALSACFGCLVLLYSIFMMLVLPAAVGNYVAKDQFGAAFRFGEVFALVQKNLGAYLMVLLIVIAAGFVSGLVGPILCLVGILFTTFWATLVFGHATGQAYREASTSIGLV